MNAETATKPYRAVVPLALGRRSDPQPGELVELDEATADRLLASGAIVDAADERAAQDTRLAELEREQAEVRARLEEIGPKARLERIDEQIAALQRERDEVVQLVDAVAVS